MANGSWHWVLMCLVSSVSVGATELYRWVDDQGRVHVSDRLPPDQTSYRALNARGLPIREVAPPEIPDPNDLAARQAQAREADRLRRLYASEAEISALRDQRIEDLKASLAFLQDQRASLTAQLAALKTRQRTFAESGKAAPPLLQAQIRRVKADLDAHDRAIAERQTDMTHTRAVYAADLKAYRALVSSETAGSPESVNPESGSPRPHP
ncbi:DUF4124 domain-containing protein [Candidatus Macondimonas diazotrophica]|jgi:hypothetical protein|uniref:DUF4124 domain-containing protein n=1 Tax=Candidatus Macondimonas diazotrophica TaxID=2305248 RepID=A0A4Z0FAR8_9GAMM|nr:DUF4124 domain-containing protein [Candidatus Macondimonas diazotrophica]NCU00419.1 DUF4124 domain-containing protein [Candidatus Macondimonas diazotrophica]TFZ82739.1 DUF4124 domain-containing protein [Candidatus Macondimonas diazotrophica]HBG30297.1 hypothetical protein [Gammaproteobacteria bacterium]HBG52129.1 hypothetical protein [Gammaproteobacteria bacterium]